ISIGTYGGNRWSTFDMRPAYRIISVKIGAGDVIDCMNVTFTYYRKMKTRHYSGTSHEIVLEEDEYVVGMEREVSTYHGVVIVGKLVFIITKKAYGPLGNMGGTPFALPIAAGKISGLFGRGCMFLDATPLGVYLEP
uniref:Jacalin-type lectin domain-containing protein n=1 Tax=Musa acuminata subsp. malaccensis TaxID=214687 RepID=A0A804KI36_MUSAM